MNVNFKRSTPIQYYLYLFVCVTEFSLLLFCLSRLNERVNECRLNKFVVLLYVRVRVCVCICGLNDIKINKISLFKFYYFHFNAHFETWPMLGKIVFIYSFLSIFDGWWLKFMLPAQLRWPMTHKKNQINKMEIRVNLIYARMQIEKNNGTSNWAPLCGVFATHMHRHNTAID